MGVASIDSSVFNAEIFNNITGKCPEVDIEIENQPIRSLIDTGSQVSTIRHSCHGITAPFLSTYLFSIKFLSSFVSFP